MLNSDNTKFRTVNVSVSDAVMRISLSVPQKRNPLSRETMTALQGAIDEAADASKVRAVVLTHEGPVFSAGHDLKEVTAARDNPDQGQAFFKELMTQCSTLMQSIVQCPKPVIAMVDGMATAAGCQLVASCDLAYASTTSRFATPGVHIGLFCSTPMVALSRSVSRKHAMEMLLTGEPVSAEKAATIGLINQALPKDTLRAHVDGVADHIAGKSAATVKIGKQAFYAQAEMTLADAYAYASEVMVENLAYKDAQEGISAFIEKRTPKWQDE